MIEIRELHVRTDQCRYCNRRPRWEFARTDGKPYTPVRVCDDHVVGVERLLFSLGIIDNRQLGDRLGL